MNISAPTQQPVLQQTLVFDPTEALSKGVNTASGKRTMITFISSNASTLRQILRVK
ncbi:hypothetical protein LU631_09835 [Erwinia tracheiphila]|uniref:hypothetical protein n=1 Tax=Erwinia tracheiphila TaxID=65700 RepID=UPI0003A1EDD9|nr:hypothetical protein [Erwinia tracheiphila]UIA82263.1 hypothetical protein LU604_16960 [Erwinia tracheiphila]UIA89458.1 hypothetical protein LU631_09835 [Erwinia tracheiphila]UIA90860.1 hypothetical protein LU632_16550 [Erwinia tracheiphila]UIA97840.1 hypothetical protein LU633_08515 [Erwinia tracheiphila]